MTRFAELLRILVEADVEFLLIGGVAALAPHKPYLRGAPPGLPFRWDLATLRAGLNFTLVTELGWMDLLGEITGGDSYVHLLLRSTTKT